ncbi:RNA polymerase II transcriptional coactivator KIWI [Glycine max]|uniref:RNA polymerase II transcriptional coactivator KIWI-like n=1 Tax=Glycine max TaxID=3847 RepID=UPI001B354D25|nr:RNA polymerase II transcriptional coactivator KIWI-like [Glycine max]KAH1194055.1 RNA polymerase II transcriptional coactivator KIWI [Glycine max]
MSGKAKRRDDDGASDTDSNSEGHVSPKKSLKKDYDDDPDSITICEISNNKRVSVRKWKGNIMVDIHEFYIKDGKQLAGRKGWLLLASFKCLFLFFYVFVNLF